MPELLEKEKGFDKLFLSLPLPPTINSYYGLHGHRRYMTEKGKKFKAEVASVVKKQPIRFGAEKLELTMTVYFRDRRIADISNRVKALEDALVQAGLMNDDSQIKALHVYEGGIVKGGKCEVEIKKLSF